MLSAGYTDPRPIQTAALPAALEGRDVLGLAQTGTGKTAAFVLPILQRLMNAGGRAPRALVVAPTRELASQVHSEFEKLAAHTPLKAVAIFGGVPIARQQRALRQHPDIVVACPGRLLDLMNQGFIKLDGVEVLVLDEADHMFDMGFLPDVRRILKACPERRQNLMFSATMPPEIRKLADAILRQPKVVELANARPAETIEHSLIQLAESDKIGVTEALLEGDDFTSAIVFLRTKRRAKKLAQRLDERGHRAVALQGNMSQPQRERALKGFRAGTFDVLVATDIAARGLDIAGVSHVINFDVPNTPDAYTHRIGRTGRSECTGSAFTLVTGEDRDQVRAIEKRLGARIDLVRLSELGPIRSESLKGGGRGGSPGAFGRPAGRGRPQQAQGGRPGQGSKPGGRRGPAQPAGARPQRTRATVASGAGGRGPAAGARDSAGARPTSKRPDSKRPSAGFGTGVHDGGARSSERGGRGAQPSNSPVDSAPRRSRNRRTA